MDTTMWLQDDGEEGAGPGVAQHLGSLPLAPGNGLDAAPVDLGKVSRIVDGKRDHDRDQLVADNIGTEQIIGPVCDRQQLQHQRRAAQDGDTKPCDRRHRLELAHAQKGDDHTQRQRKQKCQEKDGTGPAQTFAHLKDHGH